MPEWWANGFFFKEPAESFLQETHHFTTWDCPQKLRWNVGWKQGRRDWSQEGQREGEELDTECVVTTSSRSLDHRHACCTHTQTRCFRVRRNQHATTIHPRSTPYPSGVTDGVTQVRVKSWHQCHYILKRERGNEFWEEEFAHRCQELNMGKMLVYSMSLNVVLHLQ